jgi:hypothetical protein
MKVYRTDKDGISIWRLVGVIEREDALILVRSLNKSGQSNRGCLILDFEHVEYVDCRAFQLLDDCLFPCAEVLLSGLNDYLLDNFVFARRKSTVSIYSSWKRALRYLMVERGKIGTPVSTSFIGNK